MSSARHRRERIAADPVVDRSQWDILARQRANPLRVLADRDRHRDILAEKVLNGHSRQEGTTAVAGESVVAKAALRNEQRR